MLFMLILVGALIGLVVFAFFLSRKVEYGEARFNSETGKLAKNETAQSRGPVVPASRIGNIHAEERETDNE